MVPPGRSSAVRRRHPMGDACTSGADDDDELMRRFGVFSLAAPLVLLLLAAPAAAHGADGALALEAQTTNDPAKVEIRARLTYANDREPASGASVTVDGTGPKGESIASETMTAAGAGIYTATVQLPASGTWTLRVTATLPSAVGEIEYSTAVAATTTTADATGTVSEPARSSTTNDDSNSWLLPAALGAVVVIFAGGAMVILRRRARSS